MGHPPGVRDHRAPPPAAASSDTSAVAPASANRRPTWRRYTSSSDGRATVTAATADAGPVERGQDTRHRGGAVVGASRQAPAVHGDLPDAATVDQMDSRSSPRRYESRSSTCTASPRSSPLSPSGVPVDDDAARVHDGQSVGEPIGLLQIVRGQQDRDPLVGGQSRPISAHSADRASGSSPVVGSSRKSTAGRCTSPSGDIEPALHAAGVGLHRTVGRVGESKRSSSSADPPLERRAAEAVEPALQQ